MLYLSSASFNNIIGINADHNFDQLANHQSNLSCTNTNTIAHTNISIKLKN